MKPSSCKLNYCNLSRKVGRRPTFPTPGLTNSLGTCLFMYNGVFMTFMLICHDPSTLRPPGRECWCICNDFFQVHAKFHDCVQVMSSCHVFAFLWEFAKNSHFYKFYHECGAFGLHQSSCDAGHLAFVTLIVLTKWPGAVSRDIIPVLFCRVSGVTKRRHFLCTQPYTTDLVGARSESLVSQKHVVSSRGKCGMATW